MLYGREKYISKICTVVLSLFVLTACGSDLIQSINQFLDDAEQAALESIIDEVATEGGAAQLVTAETEVDLSITDESSPIYGTRVQFPAKSLPDDVRAAALSLRPADSLKLRKGEQQAGPGVLIELRNLTGMAHVRLKKEATVTLPYKLPKHEVTADTDARLQLAHQLDDDWEHLKGRSIDTKKLLIKGLTLSFSPFAAVLTATSSAATEVTTANDAGQPSNLLTYAIHDTSSVICEGNFDLSNRTFFPNLQYHFDTTGMSSYELEVSLPENSNGRFDIYSSLNTEVPVPNAGPVDLVADASFHDLNVFCDGERAFNWDGNGISKVEAEVSEWSTESTNANNCGTFSQPCTIHFGSARVTVNLDFQDSNTTWLRGEATVDVVIPEASWEVPD